MTLGYGLALDSAGRATVTGPTSSSDFPTTPSAFDPAYNGGFDALRGAAQRRRQRPRLRTFLGGSDDDGAIALALDSRRPRHRDGRHLL